MRPPLPFAFTELLRAGNARRPLTHAGSGDTREKGAAHGADSQAVQVAGQPVTHPGQSPEAQERGRRGKKGDAAEQTRRHRLCVSHGRELTPGTHNPKCNSNSSPPLGLRTPTTWKQKCVHVPALALRMAILASGMRSCWVGLPEKLCKGD